MHKLILAVSLGATAVVPALIPISASAADGKGTLSIVLENDLFGAGTDEHYTHGTEINYVSDTYQPDWLKSFAGGVGLYDEGDELRVAWSLGQQMYTPSDLEATDVVEDDRPYAGWLYTSFGLTSDSRVRAERDGSVRTIDRFEVILGIVGPDSRAEQAQKALHSALDSDEPQGWDNQLHDEGTIDFAYQREWLVPLVSTYVDIVPRAGIMLGTSQRFAGAGATLRVGSGINSDAGPPLMRPTATGSYYFKPTQRFYWYLFAGAHGRYVEHNIFLDGNTDGDSHSVEHEDWVGEVQAGLVAGVGNWRLSVTEIIRSREFEGQDEPDEFGSVALSYRF